jgi:3-oxoacyl-[acyl-carrier protein] reductase
MGVGGTSVALVTGGGSGIGAATVRRLAARGVATVVADVSLEPARALADEVAATAASLAVACDVTRPDDLVAAVDAAAGLGDLDVLVCCAGLPGDAVRLEAFPLEQWERVLQVNTMGVVHALRAVTPGMRARGRGAVVTVASIAGVSGSRRQVAYSGAKAAVVGITQAAAKELMADGIRVNAVAPGFIATPMTDAMSERTREAWRVDQLTLGGRLGRADEVAAAIDFLASPDASYVTGVTLTVDGGFTLGFP